MLTEKDYCNLEITDELRKLGYPKWPYEAMDMDSRLRIIPLYNAQKWLREEKRIFVYIDVPWKTDDGLGWSYFCCNKPMTEEDKEVCFASGGFYDSYEEALLEGIKQAIYILKEK